MKKFLLIFFILIIVFGVLLYQSPALRHKLSSLLPTSVNDQIQKITPDKLLNKTKPLYKWKDKQGQWIVSDSPPTDGSKYETLQYDQDSNVIPSKQITGKDE